MRLKRHTAPAYQPSDAALVGMAWTDPWTPTHRDLVDLWMTIARTLGYLVTVMHDSRGEHWAADSGWPDVVMVREGRMYAIEIKVPPDDITNEQAAWIRELDRVPGVMAGIFRSSGDKAHDMAVISDVLREPPRTLPRAEGHL